jgi:hypothetical protein
MQRGPQEVARGIAREDPAGAIAAVRGWGQSDQQDPPVRVAEPGDRPAPVGLIAKPCDLLAGDPLAPLDEARAAPAFHDLRGQRGERRPVHHRPT